MSKPLVVRLHVSVTHEVDDIAGDAESQRQGWESVLVRLVELFG